MRSVMLGPAITNYFCWKLRSCSAWCWRGRSSSSNERRFWNINGHQLRPSSSNWAHATVRCPHLMPFCCRCVSTWHLPLHWRQTYLILTSSLLSQSAHCLRLASSAGVLTWVSGQHSVHRRLQSLRSIVGLDMVTRVNRRWCRRINFQKAVFAAGCAQQQQQLRRQALRSYSESDVLNSYLIRIIPRSQNSRVVTLVYNLPDV